MARKARTIALALMLFASTVVAQDTDDEITSLDAVALRSALATGTLSAERVTAAFLRRIEALDDAGPQLGAVIELNPDALAVARQLDRRRAEAPIGPLHGVPVLLKANIDTADRMATSAGSAALAAHRATVDAAIVGRLRAAGAVLLGKTNLSEWANFRSFESTSGWSSLGGQTRNPYVLDRNPCGSSSGSAVAVAARLAPLAVGTETDGSIVCPAGANGVVGIKPTTGWLPNDGIVPISPRQDTAGAFGRTVADAALLLGVLAGDSTAAGRSPVTAPLSLRGLRVGVLRSYHGAGIVAEVEAVMAETLGTLAGGGATLVDPVVVPWSADVSRAELALLLVEFRGAIDGYLQTVRGGPRSLAELIAYNDEHTELIQPHFGQDLFLAARASTGNGPDYAKALATVDDARRELAAVFASERLDVLLAPANAPAWLTDWQNGDAFLVSSSRFAAISGYPSVVVPAGLADGLPLGVAFIGKPNDERTLLAIAAAFESRRGAFPPPQFLATQDDARSPE